MKVPFNDPARCFIKYQDKLQKSIIDTAISGAWLLGAMTEKFSKGFALYCGTTYCLPVANGTDALELSLRAVLSTNEISKNEVITVANAGGYTSIACRLVGAIPVYADIDSTTQLISIESIENCLGPHVKAIVLTHLYGGVIDVNSVRAILVNNGYAHVKVIEDCAQAHGANIAGQVVGSFGDLAAFSFYPTKNLGALGDAGAIVSSDATLFQKVKHLSQYGWGSKYHIDHIYGRNSRMDEIQAAILGDMLPYLDQNNQLRKNIYEQYKNSSKKLIPIDISAKDFVAHLAVFKVQERNSFMSFMSNRGISVAIHYPVLDSEQVAWMPLEKRIDMITNMENSKKSVNEIVTLPCFPYMTQDEIDYVCHALHDWGNL